jgi:hypothetical protein
MFPRKLDSDTKTVVNVARELQKEVLGFVGVGLVFFWVCSEFGLEAGFVFLEV